MKHMAYLYVFDTMADWEIGYLTAELNSGRYFRKGLPPIHVVTVGISKAPVVSKGGLRIIPDRSLDECDFGEADALVLPGGDTWMDAMHDPVLRVAGQCLEGRNILVAAICGATAGLARVGLLDSRRHTSNDLGYLKMVCSGYAGDALYQNEVAVTDGTLITASGIAPLEFTAHVLRALDVFRPQTLEAWLQLYLTHEPRFFYKLMKSIE